MSGTRRPRCRPNFGHTEVQARDCASYQDMTGAEGSQDQVYPKTCVPRPQIPRTGRPAQCLECVALQDECALVIGRHRRSSCPAAASCSPHAPAHWSHSRPMDRQPYRSVRDQPQPVQFPQRLQGAPRAEASHRISAWPGAVRCPLLRCPLLQEEDRRKTPQGSTVHRREGPGRGSTCEDHPGRNHVNRYAFEIGLRGPPNVIAFPSLIFAGTACTITKS